MAADKLEGPIRHSFLNKWVSLEVLKGHIDGRLQIFIIEKEI